MGNIFGKLAYHITARNPGGHAQHLTTYIGIRDGERDLKHMTCGVKWVDAVVNGGGFHGLIRSCIVVFCISAVIPNLLLVININ
jgi:hypothetical protein